MARSSYVTRGSRVAPIGVVVGIAIGAGACAQIIGLEPWEGSSSGGGGPPGASSASTSGAGGNTGAATSSSSSSSTASASSSSSSASSSSSSTTASSSSASASSSSSSGGNVGLCKPCQSNNECMSGCCKGLICITDINGCILIDGCSDGCKDGLETDIDCGGQNLCARCGVGMRCKVPADCEMGLLCQQNGLFFFCS